VCIIYIVSRGGSHEVSELEVRDGGLVLGIHSPECKVVLVIWNWNHVLPELARALHRWHLRRRTCRTATSCGDSRADSKTARFALTAFRDMRRSFQSIPCMSHSSPRRSS